MPAVNPNNASQQGTGPQRTSFRPPWVKEGPTPLPMPSAPWAARARESQPEQQPNKADKTAPRKLSKVTIIPSQPNENNVPENIGQQAGSGGRESQRRESATTIPIAVESKRKESTDRTVPIKVESKRKEPTDTGPQGRRKESIVQIKKEPVIEAPKPTSKPTEQPKSILKDPSKSSVPSVPKPPPPPAPPMAPPMPPPPPPQKPLIETEMTPQKAIKLEALRSRPRRRPDWTDMMKEVESGIKLKHIQCNDRSAPILPQAKAKGQFVYESEKENKRDPHKQLLNQIQQGVKLKRVKCNDRSKPILDGLRKFRRQMTIEEQIQKSMSMADVVAAAAEPDELDDIDKVRDDLQSTKQMLALELRNKEALERENKRLMARLLNLEVELEKEKNSKTLDSEKGMVIHTNTRSEADEKLVQQLKEEASDAHRVAKEMEDKYKYTAEELDGTRAKLEKAWLKNQQLEMELKSGARSNLPITKQPSAKKLAASMTNVPNGKGSYALESEEESEYTDETETETESEEEENESNAAALQEKRVARELKLLATKLRSYKEKQASALRERHSLREQLRKQQKTLKDEKKKYKALQKEVDKMAKLMKDDEEDEEEEEEKPEEEVEEEEEETESESESEESEEEELTDGDLPEDASVDDRRKNLTDRSKHHETRLGTLKKGNYLLKANIDRLQDDINRQREMSLALQEDLNSVLAELG